MDPKDQERLVEQWLDTALKQRGAIEPRIGLEGRILAGIRANQERTSTRWWQWQPIFATLASVLLIGSISFLKWKPRVDVPPAPVSHLPGPTLARQPARRTGVQVAIALKPRRYATAPHLDQFPSPQPLSEQEKALAQYVASFHREAILMARAETELLRREEIERTTSSPQEISEHAAETNP